MTRLRAAIVQPWLLIPLFGLLLIGGMWGRTLNQLATEETRALTTAMRDTESFVAAFEQHMLRALNDADRTARVVKHEFERHGRADVPGLVSDGLIPAQGFTLIGVTDRAGHVVASSQPLAASVNLADRDYFQLHALRDIGQFDISKPQTGVLSPRKSIHLTRRLNLRDGSFAGIVFLSVEPDHFTNFYESYALGDRGVIGVLGKDGTLRARRTGDTVTTEEVNNTTLYARSATSAHGSFESEGPLDGVQRLMVYRTLSEYPLIVYAAQAKDEVLEDVVARRTVYVWATSAATLVIVAFFALATVLVRRLSRSRARAQEARRFLRTLVDNVPFGISVRSVQDGDAGKLVLWNETNGVIMGIHADDALGHTIGEILPSAAAEHIGELDRQLIASPMVQEVPQMVVEVPGRGRRTLHFVRVPIFGVDDEVEYIASITNDITAEIATVNELRLAAKVFETTADAVIVSDADDRIVTVNAAFSTLTLFAPEDVVGRIHGESAFRPIDPIDSETRMERQRREGHFACEVTRFRKDGQKLTLWGRSTCVRDDAGSIVNYVRVFTDISTLKESQSQLERLANFDSLTGLPNRRSFLDRFEQALRRADRAGHGVALLFIDLDSFKEVNDTRGHGVGDVLLQEVARRLQACSRSADGLCRLGGDEFTVVLEGAAVESQATLAANRILAALMAPIRLGGHEFSTTASIGIALYPDDGDDAETMLRSADAAMYRAKAAGRNRVMLSPNGDSRIRRVAQAA